MVRALLFALLFVIIGAVGFALIAPLLFRGADLEQLGEKMFPFIFLVCGTAGLVVGWRTRKKS